MWNASAAAHLFNLGRLDLQACMAFTPIAASCTCDSLLCYCALLQFAGGEYNFPSLEPLRAPLLELVRQQGVVARELRVTNMYLRHGANSQYKYTSSQATQHRDPTFKSTLIKVRR